MMTKMEKMALIYAQVAYIEGMKAENAQRIQNNCTLAYMEREFCCCAIELERLANIKEED